MLAVDTRVFQHITTMILLSIVFSFATLSVKRYERNELNHLANVGFAVYFWVC